MRGILIGSIALLSFSVAAWAGPPSQPIDIDVAKKAGGPWLDAGFFRRDVGQQPKSIFWRVKTTEESKIETTATEEVSAGEGDYRIRWYRGDQNVTDKLEGDGLDLKLKPDKFVKFEARVKAKFADPEPVCLSPRFEYGEPVNFYSYSVYVNDDSVCG